MNKRTKKDVSLWEHHSHAVTHCVNIFLSPLTTSVTKINIAVNNISEFLDFRSGIYMGGSTLTCELCSKIACT